MISYIFLYLANIPPVILSTYSSSLTNNTQSYRHDRYLGSKFYYEALQINVITSDSYTFSSNSGIDLYGYFYKDYFNPFNISENLLLENVGACGLGAFKLFTSLQPNTTYILVVTTYLSNETGEFEIFSSGRNNIIFNRTSKSL